MKGFLREQKSGVYSLVETDAERRWPFIQTHKQTKKNDTKNETPRGFRKRATRYGHRDVKLTKRNAKHTSKRNKRKRKKTKQKWIQRSSWPARPAVVDGERKQKRDRHPGGVEDTFFDLFFVRTRRLSSVSEVQRR